MCGLETFPVVPHLGPLSPYDPEKVALHLLVDSGMLPACWLMSDYLQGPGVSQRPARPTPHHQPHSWGSNWSARIWGQPSTSTPMPPRCKNYFSSLCFDIDHSPEGPTNGPELFQPLTRALPEINHRPTFAIHETFLGLTVKIAWHQKKKRYIKFCSTKNTNFLWL